MHGIQDRDLWSAPLFSFVPLKPTDQNQQQAEVLLAYLGGSADHPVAIAIADRRHRPKNLKPGESAHHDDQKQAVHLTRAGINQTGKKVTITGGDDGAGKAIKPDTQTFELNEQLKGVQATLMQLKDSHHALHAAVSDLRTNAEAVIPALAPLNIASKVTDALNGLPSGLDAMKARAAGKLQDYFQKAMQNALGSFLDAGRLLGVTSLLSGNAEGLIAAAQAQIAGLLSANPVVGLVDGLREELAACQASGGPPAAVAAKAADLAGQIAGLVGANPVIAQVDALRRTLQGLLDQAGPGLNFLEPQKRLAQKLTRSMRFGGPG